MNAREKECNGQKMTKRRRTPDVESRWAAKGKEGEVEEEVVE